MKKHFNKKELVSIIQTFVAFAGVDAVAQINQVLAGDWSKPVLLALVSALVRSLLKAVYTVVTAK